MNRPSSREVSSRGNVGCRSADKPKTTDRNSPCVAIDSVDRTLLRKSGLVVAVAVVAISDIAYHDWDVSYRRNTQFNHLLVVEVLPRMRYQFTELGDSQARRKDAL